MKRTINCGECGKIFTTYHSKAEFCSRICANTNRGRRMTGVAQGPRSKPLAERFWEKVDKIDDCWTWQASKGGHGYGRFYMNGTQWQANRAAFFLAHGTIDPELDVCHTCDNPACVRPDHLWQGTESDNMQDCIRKGRKNAATGDRNGMRIHRERSAFPPARIHPKNHLGQTYSSANRRNP
jgi:hypothetical protein